MAQASSGSTDLKHAKTYGKDEDEIICANEVKHSVAMMRKLKLMTDNNDLCDFVIKVDEDEYRVHRNILSAGSEYFKAMFKHETKEKLEGKVEMVDVDSQCVKCCLDYMYTGKFKIPGEKVGELLHVAIMLQLNGVKQAACGKLKKSINAENFYSTKFIADMYALEDLSSELKAYFKNNLKALSAQPGFQNETESLLTSMFSSRIMRSREDEKLAISLRWAGEDPNKRDALLRVLAMIKMEEIPDQYLKEILANDPTVSSDFALYKLISKMLLANSAKTNKASGIQENTCVEVTIPAKDTRFNKANPEEPKRKTAVTHAVKTPHGINNTRHNDLGMDFIILFDQEADCLQCYDPITSEVARFQDAQFCDMQDFSATALGSHIYVLNENKSVWRLNFRKSDSNWEKMREMIYCHGNHPNSVICSGSLFVIGHSNIETARGEYFQPESNTWAAISNKPVPICGASFVALDDSIYCIGGSDVSTGKRRITSSFCKFKPANSLWTDLEPMEYARKDCASVAVERRIFVTGGVRFGCMNKLECYSLVSSQWTSLSPMIGPHGFCDAFCTDGWIFVVTRMGSLDSVEKYNIRNNKWYKVEVKGDGDFKIYDSVSVSILTLV